MFPFIPDSVLHPRPSCLQSVALACVYLAAKIMEAPKALRDVVLIAEKYRYKQYAVKHPEEAKFWEDRVRHVFPCCNSQELNHLDANRRC